MEPFLTNKEKLLNTVWIKDSLGCSDHDSVHLKILRGLTKGRTAIRDFKRAHLRLLRKPGGRRWKLHCRENCWRHEKSLKTAFSKHKTSPFKCASICDLHQHAVTQSSSQSTLPPKNK